MCRNLKASIAIQKFNVWESQKAPKWILMYSLFYLCHTQSIETNIGIDIGIQRGIDEWKCF